MRLLVTLICLVALAAAGCASKKAAMSPPGTAPGTTSASLAASASQIDPSVLTTPEAGLVGKVARVNTAGRFVVLTFPVGHLPAVEQRLMVYRSGLKVGEVKVTGPQLDDNIVGDVVVGNALAGDAVRDR